MIIIITTIKIIIIGINIVCFMCRKNVKDRQTLNGRFYILLRNMSKNSFKAKEIEFRHHCSLE